MTNPRHAHHCCPALWLVLLTGMAAQATTYYVATNGNDSTNDGLSTNTPFATIQKAESLTHPGDTVSIRGGVYREEVWVTNYGTPGNLILYEAYPGETPVIKATDVVTNWTHFTNSIWQKPGWEPEPQQVIDDGSILTQIGTQRYIRASLCKIHGTNLNDMVPGSFYYDRNETNLYTWLADGSDPNDSYMEASTRVFTFFRGYSSVSTYLHVKGITFMYGNSCTVTSGWPTVLAGGYSTIEDCNVLRGDFGGISLGWTSQLIRCNVSENGDLGISAADGFLISHCTLNSNNYREFSPSAVAGGTKIYLDCHGTIENCEVGWNKGPGIWIDTCKAAPTVICSNYVHNNEQHGIFLEISAHNLVHHNLAVDNVWHNIYLASSESNDIHHNVVVGNSDWVSVEMAYFPTRTNEFGIVYPMRDNTFRNNIVYGHSGIAETAMVMPDGTDVVNNVVDYNIYFRTNTALLSRFILNRIGQSGIGYTNFPLWVEETGWDAHSHVVDPLFVDPVGGDYHLRSTAGTYSNGIWSTYAQTSPAIDTGHPSSTYSNETAWNGGRVNVGLYGNTPEASRSPDQDSDGVSDPIEIYELHSDPANADTDSDGATDYEEYIGGSDATDPSSCFLIDTPTNGFFGTNGVRLTWYGVSGRIYTVHSSSDLTSGLWTARSDLVTEAGVPVSAPTGSNQWITAIDTNVFVGTGCFYRIKALWQ